MRTHARNELRKGGADFEGLIGNCNLSKVMVYFDETLKLASAGNIIIQTGNTMLVVIKSQNWDKCREERVWCLDRSPQSHNDPSYQLMIDCRSCIFGG